MWMALLWYFLGDLQGRRGDDFLPAQAHVRAEDDHSRQVEEHPAERLEDLELHAVDIAHVHRLASWGVNPEEGSASAGAASPLAVARNGKKRIRVWVWRQLGFSSGPRFWV